MVILMTDLCPYGIDRCPWTLFDETLVQRINRLLEEQRMSKYQLAKSSGMGTAYLTQLMQGKVKNPRVDTLQALSEALNISFGELVGECRKCQFNGRLYEIRFAGYNRRNGGEK
jgi:transcriptional regulator with XRE-family HTH domain